MKAALTQAIHGPINKCIAHEHDLVSLTPLTSTSFLDELERIQQLPVPRPCSASSFCVGQMTRGVSHPKSIGLINT
ncbi:hypothetical protein I7I53_03630 [Histoplasma capsulatum var. duboisii H88]|uniref:Uncharacterized protein n=1 Tax=Ajellomyces capsulatus (strain H88) TaxID=544711 RepID=A0A8A1LP12_AJEC8|nr:hypothetical protein I7I53_03630 [Histoplasma capsulatum var. duboisii H88]